MNQQPSKVVTELRKAGKLDEAWNVGCPAVQQNPHDNYLKGAFFWVCYAYLKQVQEPIKQRGQTRGNFQPNQTELDRINFYIDWIRWLSIPPGGFEYRSLLLLFQKNLESIPMLVLLLFTYRTTLFEPEDKAPYQSDRGESPSLMLTFVRKVARAWMDNKIVQQISIADLRQLFAQVRREAKDKQHIIWLDYDEAKCLIFSGNLETAREFIIPVLRKKQSESWAWGALAATYIKDDIDRAITLYSQGLCYSHDEKFALRLLKGIAPLLVAKGFTQQASMCIQRAVNCYQANGWNIKPDIENFQQQPWFDASVNVDELKSFLQTQSKGALDALHGPASKAIGLVTNLHKSGKGLHLYLAPNESISVPLRVIKGRASPKVGDYLAISIAGDDDEKMVLTAELTTAQTLSGVESIQDELRVTDKGFGFVGDTFIPPHLIREGMDKQLVEVLRYKDFDKKKGKLGWRALSLEVCS